DVAQLANLCDERILKKKRAEVERSLHGLWKAEHLFALQQALSGWEFCQAQVAECDAALTAQLSVLTRDLPPPPQRSGSSEAAPKKKNRARQQVPQVPQLHGSLLTLSGGHDAAQLPGFTPTSWRKLLSEVGTDLSRWPNEKAFCAWLCLSPGKNQSGKLKRRTRRRAKTAAGQIFRLAAHSIARSKYLAMGGFYRRLKARTCAAVANVA